MENRNDENLKELFERFLKPEQAAKASEDIEKAEQILSGSAAPEPDEALLVEIKAKVSIAAERRKRRQARYFVYKTAAVAAAVIILAAVSLRFQQEQGGMSEEVFYASLIPKAIWESEDLASDDSELAALNREIEQAEKEVLALQLSETNGNGLSPETELEIELLEIESTFWKG